MVQHPDRESTEPPTEGPNSAPGTHHTVTQLLQRWSAGDSEAREEVVPRVYDELHRIAAGYFRTERPSHTLQATAILNEALFRLLDRNNIQWQNGAHFIGTAARMMRHILVDHARERKATKRGGDHRRITLSEVQILLPEKTPDILALDEALEKLARVDPQKVSVVELRFFGGLTMAEIAIYLGISEATVSRQWRRARAWLYGELSTDGG